jgi:hypothetical protein
MKILQSNFVRAKIFINVLENLKMSSVLTLVESEVLHEDCVYCDVEEYYYLE